MITDKEDYICKKAWVEHYNKEVLHSKELIKTTHTYDLYILRVKSTILSLQKELDEYESNNMKVIE